MYKYFISFYFFYNILGLYAAEYYSTFVRCPPAMFLLKCSKNDFRLSSAALHHPIFLQLLSAMFVAAGAARYFIFSCYKFTTL